MIPKHIIEKAIAGGWGAGKSKYLSEMHEFLTENPQRFYQVALDPDFWMALGKEMGWGKTDRCWGCNYDEGATTDTDVWFVNAHRVYDLILRKTSQEEIDNFWKLL